MGDRMKEEILYTRSGRNESKVDSDNGLRSEKQKLDENISLEDDNANFEKCLSFPQQSSNSMLDDETVLSNDEDICILGTSPLPFQDLIDEKVRKRHFDEHTEKYANADMPLNWTEIASLLFFLSLKTTSLGYDRGNNYHRIVPDHISECSDCLNLKTDRNFASQCVGSIAEGVDIPGHSDLDIMIVCKRFECYEELSKEKDVLKNNTTVFISDRRYASPGYTLLWDVQSTKQYCDYDDDDDDDKDKFKMNPFRRSLATVSFPNTDIRAILLKNLLIKQNEIKDFLRKTLPVQVSRTGPAIHSSFFFPPEIKQTFINILTDIFDDKNELKRIEAAFDKLKLIDFDIVLAVPFESKAIMQQWSERRRRHNWPPRELLQEISKMSGHVVPVGKKGSTFEKYEFRICYTLAEIKLIRSLNEVQTLLFMILRVYAKDRKGSFPNISSYIIKNVILWLAESVEPSYFKPENMIPLIKSTLQVIKRCAEKGSLPNYMIPSRNLFDGKVKVKERQRLIDVLSRVTKQGCDVIIMQFDKSISEIIAGVRSDKLHTFVEKHKEMERKKRMISKFIPALLHGHIKATMLHAVLSDNEKKTAHL